MAQSQNPLEVVRRYHQAWSTQRYQEAVELLDERLQVEVPINDYPTRGAFAQALGAFGSMVQRVDVLSELSGQNEAMLLYDAEVAGVGQMRIAEHFTVQGGRIVRLRQVHDTVAVRAAGLGK